MSAPEHQVKKNAKAFILVIQTSGSDGWRAHSWGFNYKPSPASCKMYAHGLPWTLYQAVAINDSTEVETCEKCGQKLPEDRPVKLRETVYPIF